MNRYSAALETARSAVQDAVGPGVLVTRDPAQVGPRVARDGVAVLIAPLEGGEPSSFETQLVDVPAQILYPSPAGPVHLDRAYDVADQITLSQDYFTSGPTNRTVQLDAATALPAVVLTLQISTQC